MVTIEDLNTKYKIFQREWKEGQIVKCIHCGRKFPITEANVIHDEEWAKDAVVCKYYGESCDGILADFFPIKE